MKRFSVLYLFKEQYHHVGCDTHTEAKTILQKLTTDSERTAVGIYDAKTELFEWEPTRQRAYNQAGIAEQGKLGDQIITIVEALRRRDSNGLLTGDFRRPSFFA